MVIAAMGTISEMTLRRRINAYWLSITVTPAGMPPAGRHLHHNSLLVQVKSQSASVMHPQTQGWIV
jgi:hypothetical protein